MPTSSVLSIAPETVISTAADLIEMRQRIESAPFPEGEISNGSGSNGLITEIVAAITALNSGRKSPVDLAAVCSLVETVIRHGWVSSAASEERVRNAESLMGQTWNRQLASLVIAPAWQIGNLPDFSKVSLPLWPTYAEAYFHVPSQYLDHDHADRAGALFSRRTSELVRAAESNPGSQAVRSAAAVCLNANLSAFRSAPQVLNRIHRLQRDLKAALSNRRKAIDFASFPRAGRSLTIALVLPSLADSRRVRTALSWIQSLDPQRFARSVYFTGTKMKEIEVSLVSQGIAVQELLGSLDDQIATLQANSPDCLISAISSTWPIDLPGRLLDRRLAPVQIALQEDGVCSPSVHTDAMLTDLPLKNPNRFADFAEQVIAVPSSGIRLPRSPESKESGRSWSRDALGITNGDILLSSIAPFSLLSPEWVACVAHIMRTRPETKLLVYSYAEEDANPTALSRLCSLLGPVMMDHGVAAERLIISNEALGGVPELEALLKISDVHLDSFPVTDREGSLVAIASGCPVVTLQSSCGLPSPCEHALEILGLLECAAPSHHEFAVQVIALVGDAEKRMSVRGRIAVAPEGHDFNQDPTVFGESLGAVLELLFDQALQAAPSRRNRGCAVAVYPKLDDSVGIVEEASILLQAGLYEDSLAKVRKVVAWEPQNQAARNIFYKALIQAGNVAYAEPGILSACANPPTAGDAWFLLSTLRLKQGRRKDAIGLLKRHLDLHPRDIEAWSHMKVITDGAGDSELGEQIDQVIAELSGTATPGVPVKASSRSLYFSPVGKNGLEFFRKIRARFPDSIFDFLIIAYDDAEFGELSAGIELVRDRGQKWRLIKKYLTPERVANYEYVFMWDDDIDPGSFDSAQFIEILRRNHLDIAQPSLTSDSYSFHPITVQRSSEVGRLTNFVEIMCPVYAAKTWPAIYSYIDPDINEFGWGYDLIPIGRKGIVDAMPVRHTRPGQSGRAGAESQYFAWCKRYNVTRNPFVSIKPLE